MKSSPLLDPQFLKELGVLDWGYTEDPIPHSLSKYESWVNEGLHGPLNYLSDERKHLRRDIRNVFPEFQSALVFLFSYQEMKKWMLENNKHSIAAYALGFGGDDYHWALKERLNKLKDHLGVDGLITLDIQPVLERDLAYRAGLGWFGKNSMIINQKEGSYFIIGSLLLKSKLPVEPSKMDIDHCGQCNACAEACPTQALDPVTRTLDAKNCISTFTIEMMKEVPAPVGYNNSRGEVFGCDICQDVCPWNKKSLLKVVSNFSIKETIKPLVDLIYGPRENFLKFIQSESKRSFRKKFFGTVFDRPGKDGWFKNLKN